jgi:hypothetical protein
LFSTCELELVPCVVGRFRFDKTWGWGVKCFPHVTCPSHLDLEAADLASFVIL